MFQLTVWINEKMLTAQDTSYDEARNLHSKWLKHQAFMAELASNKDWLNNVDQVSQLHVAFKLEIHFFFHVHLNYTRIGV